MNLPTQGNFTFNVDHLARTHAHPRRNAAGLAKADLAHIQHRKPVDLPDPRAAGLDVYCPLQDRFPAALGNTAGSVFLGGNGLLNMFLADDLFFVTTGPVVSFL